MSTAELRLTYKPDDEWIGVLEGVVKSGAFSGRGSAWFNRTQLKETFVTALRKYPLPECALPIIEGGFFSREIPGTLSQCHIRVLGNN